MAERPQDGLPFTKMEGAGNDFIVISGEHAGVIARADAIQALCDRRRGVGADGVMVVTPGGEAEAEMAYVNRDGSSAFCGNGARCAAAFAVSVYGLPPTLTLFEAGRALSARVRRVGQSAFDVDVQMPAPPSPPRRVVSAAGVEGTFIVVGVPHLVVGVENVEGVDLGTLGPTLRSDPAVGASGANVDVVAGRGRRLELRTYERGVEAETLACGSGAVAAALVMGDVDDGTEVGVASGETLRVLRDGSGLWLSGPARIVYRGSLPSP